MFWLKVLKINQGYYALFNRQDHISKSYNVITESKTRNSLIISCTRIKQNKYRLNKKKCVGFIWKRWLIEIWTKVILLIVNYLNPWTNLMLNHIEQNLTIEFSYTLIVQDDYVVSWLRYNRITITLGLSCETNFIISQSESSVFEVELHTDFSQKIFNDDLHQLPS